MTAVAPACFLPLLPIPASPSSEITHVHLDNGGVLRFRLCDYYWATARVGDWFGAPALLVNYGIQYSREVRADWLLSPFALGIIDETFGLMRSGPRPEHDFYNEHEPYQHESAESMAERIEWIRARQRHGEALIRDREIIVAWLREVFA